MKKDILRKKILSVLENNDINIHECSDGFEIEFYSNLGEDFIFYICAENEKEFIKKFKEYGRNFDYEEHAVMWYESKDRINGVPQSIVDLLNDAKEIKEFLIHIGNILSMRLLTFEEFLHTFDFSYQKYEDGYGFIDDQCANLGDICSERYLDPKDMIERMYNSIYFDDYIIEDIGDDYVDLVKWAEENSDDFRAYVVLCCENPDLLDDMPEVLIDNEI